MLTRYGDYVVGLHPSCGLNTQSEWVIFNEFVLTTRPYIRTVTSVQPEWYTSLSVDHDRLAHWTFDRLVELAPVYFDLATFPDGGAKRALMRVSYK